MPYTCLSILIRTIDLPCHKGCIIYSCQKSQDSTEVVSSQQHSWAIRNNIATQCMNGSEFIPETIKQRQLFQNTSSNGRSASQKRMMYITAYEPQTNNRSQSYSYPFKSFWVSAGWDSGMPWCGPRFVDGVVIRSSGPGIPNITKMMVVFEKTPTI